MTTFTAATYQNEYLAEGATEVNAIVTVTARGGGAQPRTAPVQVAEIVIVDTSGSMGVPKRNIKAAKAATCAALDCIRDGVRFAVIAGTDVATLVYPPDGRLGVADAASRTAAKAEVERLKARGGTSIGSWLSLARRLFEAAPDAIHHAILLTDGENEHESDHQFRAALAFCEGRFQCDCRGIGTDWKVDELRQIASTLLGSVDMVADADDLVADFTAMMDQAMTKDTNDVELRLWAPQGANVAFVRQVAPAIQDLTVRGRPSGPLTADYPTGAWGDESRDYHVCVRRWPHADPPRARHRSARGRPLRGRRHARVEHEGLLLRRGPADDAAVAAGPQDAAQLPRPGGDHAEHPGLPLRPQLRRRQPRPLRRRRAAERKPVKDLLRPRPVGAGVADHGPSDAEGQAGRELLGPRLPDLRGHAHDLGREGARARIASRTLWIASMTRHVTAKIT